jgi:peptide/nickel transport system permease protein
LTNGRPVLTVIRQNLPPTLILTFTALLVAVVLGGSVALVATYTRARWLRQFLLSLPAAGVSLPSFWVGLVLLQLFSFRLHIFPAFGNNGPVSLVLPAITLAIGSSAVIAQLLAKSMLNVLAQPYIETARAKGASRLRIHFRHALRNAATPALTMLGVIFGELITSAVVTETVFSRTGLGSVTATSVQAENIPVVQGVVLVSAVVFVLINLAVDLVYPLLDARIVTAGAAR